MRINPILQKKIFDTKTEVIFSVHKSMQLYTVDSRIFGLGSIARELGNIKVRININVFNFLILKQEIFLPDAGS